MERLDRLGWTAGIVFTSYGVRVGIRSNDPLALEHIVHRLPFNCRMVPNGRTVKHLFSLRVAEPSTRRGVRRFNLLYANAQRIERSIDLEPVLHRLEADMQICVAANAPHKVFLHAGVVAWKGRAVLIPGVSFSGKSTLVVELIKRGAVYYSDEFALLDERGRVSPFTRPLGLRYDVAKPGLKTAPEDLGARLGKKPLPVALVALCRYRKGAHWKPRRLTPGLGAFRLIRHALPAVLYPERTVQALTAVAKQARIVEGARGEAAQTAELIIRSLDRLAASSARSKKRTRPSC